MKVVSSSVTLERNNVKLPPKLYYNSFREEKPWMLGSSNSIGDILDKIHERVVLCLYIPC